MLVGTWHGRMQSESTRASPALGRRLTGNIAKRSQLSSLHRRTAEKERCSGFAYTRMRTRESQQVPDRLLVPLAPARRMGGWALCARRRLRYTPRLGSVCWHGRPRCRPIALLPLRGELSWLNPSPRLASCPALSHRLDCFTAARSLPTRAAAPTIVRSSRLLIAPAEVSEHLKLPTGGTASCLVGPNPPAIRVWCLRKTVRLISR